MEIALEKKGRDCNHRRQALQKIGGESKSRVL